MKYNTNDIVRLKLEDICEDVKIISGDDLEIFGIAYEVEDSEGDRLTAWEEHLTAL